MLIKVVCFILLFLMVLPLITEGYFVGWKDAVKALGFTLIGYGLLFMILLGIL